MDVLQISPSLFSPSRSFETTPILSIEPRKEPRIGSMKYWLFSIFRSSKLVWIIFGWSFGRSWSERRGTQEWQSKAQENHKLDIVQTITSDNTCTPGINPYLRSDTGCTHSCELYQKKSRNKETYLVGLSGPKVFSPLFGKYCHFH